MHIGDIELANPVALAPMAGVTDLPFRRLCRELGAGYVVGEMLASDPSLRQSGKSRLRGVHREEPAPRAIQIVGWDPAIMADAARYNADQGASVIDINMGCPAKKVLKRAAGSALLGDEPRVIRILEAVVGAVQVPVTLKMRTGLAPDARNGVRIARIAEQSGIRALAVHGRTRACRYAGEAEFLTIREICNAVSIPVFANGDILHWERAEKIRRFTGAAGVMIGRGAHGAPWLPGMVARYLETGLAPEMPPLSRQRDIVLRHLDAIYRFYGNEQGVRIARKHIKWYLDSHPDPEPFRTAAVQSDCPRRQSALLSDYYNQLQNSFPEALPWQIHPEKKQPAERMMMGAGWRNASGNQSVATLST